MSAPEPTAECRPNVNVRLQPMFEKGKWCHTHTRPVSACAEIAALRAALRKTIRWVEEYHQPDGAADCEECASVAEARRALKEAGA